MQRLFPIILLAFISNSALANTEILHWWTSPGEQAALHVLEQQLSDHNISYTPSAVIGGGGDTAMMVLQARALAGNAPDIVQLEGPNIKAWDDIGLLYPLNSIAKDKHWDEKFYPLSVNINKTSHGYVALPLSLHRLNWLWVNQRLLKRLQLSVPTNWTDMLDVMEKAKNAGVQPLALGARQWQVNQLFESIVIGTGGVDFYLSTLVDLDVKKINSAQMRYALNVFRRISKITGQTLPNMDWDTATKQLIDDKALFQIGGDWILGDLLAQQIAVPNHIGCYSAPSAVNSYLYNMDSLIFVKSKHFEHSTAINIAKALADKAFQTQFNRSKGSIPSRRDIAIDDFNDCQKKSYDDFHYAINNGLAIPSMTDSMAINPVAQQAINSEIYRFFRNSTVSDNDVITRIISIAESNE